jgi:3-keto-5-aminohexanoate cleavage enzyme
VNVPYTPDEISADAVACRAARRIVHFHARKADGTPEHSSEVYAHTIRQIRSSSDILVHPTLGYNTMDDHSAPARLKHILELAKDPSASPHFVPLDMGSVNVDRYDPQARRFLTTDHVYANPTGDLMYFAKAVRAAGLKPYLTCFNIGFPALCECLRRHGPARRAAVHVPGADRQHLPGRPSALAQGLAVAPGPPAPRQEGGVDSP